MNKITRAGYVAKVKEACDFLDGASKEMLDEFKREMEGACELKVPLSVDVGVGENWRDAK